MAWESLRIVITTETERRYRESGDGGAPAEAVEPDRAIAQRRCEQ